MANITPSWSCPSISESRKWELILQGPLKPRRILLLKSGILVDKSRLELSLLSPSWLESSKDDGQKEKKMKRYVLRIGLAFLLHTANDFLCSYEWLCGVLLELSPGHNPLDMAILTQETDKHKAPLRCLNVVKFCCKALGPCVDWCYVSTWQAHKTPGYLTEHYWRLYKDTFGRDDEPIDWL